MNRRISGSLAVLDPFDPRAVAWGPAECLGLTDDAFAKAHGNASHDPLVPFGDVPFGWYRCRPSCVPTSRTKALRAEYGPAGWFVLEPISGDALQARERGAYGFTLLGGELTTTGRLRPSLCSLRVRDVDMIQLRHFVTEYRGVTEIVCAVGREDVSADDFAAEIDSYFNRFS